MLCLSHSVFNTSKLFNHKISLFDYSTTIMLSTAQIVTGDDDLLTEILLRLPIRSLLRFKLVSTHWLFLISNHTFSLLRNSLPNNPISGLFFQRPAPVVNQVFDFVPVNDGDPAAKQPFRTLNFVDDPFGLRILQSCNGLLLCCCTIPSRTGKFNYYIYNPTTNKFTTLPDPNRRVFRYIHGIESCSVNIAFEPSKSPYYKAVCVYSSETLPDHYEIEIYSSETGLWTPSAGDPFDGDVHFKLPVYWNGSIHWMSTWGNPLYFNLNTELIGTMPMPQMPESWDGVRYPFFGESGGHLHLIVIHGPQTTHFKVYEMEIDYSDWFVKYSVDLDSIPIAFPEMIRSSLDPSDLYYYRFSVLGIVREHKDEDSFLVLQIPGKAIKYKFVDNTFKKLCDFIPDDPTYEFNAFQFIESLAFV